MENLTLLIMTAVSAVQLLAAVWLCALVLQKRRYFLPRSIVGSIVFAGGCICLNYIFSVFHLDFCSILFSLLICGAFCIFTRNCTLMEAGLTSVAAVFMQYIADFLYFFAFSSIDFARLQYMYSIIGGMLTEIAVTAIFYIAAYLLLIRKHKSRTIGKNGWIYLICFSAYRLFITRGLTDSLMAMDESVMLALIQIISLIDFIFSVAIFIWIFKLTEEKEVRQEIQDIQYLIDAKSSYYQVSKESIDLINMKCHDIKKQIQSMTSLEDEMLRERLKDVESSIEIYNAVAKTGNSPIDTLLTEKSLVCQKKQITFSYMIEGKSIDFISPMECYSLFGNILDNAIEAVSEIDAAEKRIIKLDVRAVKRFLSVHQENYMQERELAFEGGLPKTTKGSRTVHGFGMKSIRYIVEKYGGELTVTSDEGVFILNILIPLS